MSTRTGPVGVGFVGTGMISDTYLENLTRFPDVEVIILGDLDPARAAAQATKHGVAEAGSVSDVLAHPEVEMVVNLTIPAVHAEIASAALTAGKNVWSEKPVSIDRDSGQSLLDQARNAGLLLGVAPDTVLGPGVQTALHAIRRGEIGHPLSAQTVIQYPGPDLFHPNPEFLFAAGGGPLFDIGPYYLTTLVHVFGSFASVAAVGSRGHATRTIKTGPRAGQEFAVEVPTHVGVVAQFEGGGVSQSVFSFESPLARMGVVEITGTEATMIIPDPNLFTGPVRITRPASMETIADEPAWDVVPEVGVVAGRGLGVLDLARCLRHGGTPVASGEVGYHILDTMMAIDEAVTTGRTVEVTSTVPDPPLVADGWDPYAATMQHQVA